MNTKPTFVKALAFLLLLFSFSRVIAQDSTEELYDRAKSLLPDKAIQAEPIASKLLMLVLDQKNPNDSMLAKTYHLLGIIQYYQSQYILATKYFNNALDTDFGRVDQKMREGCYNNLGVIYDKQERINEAYDAYTKSLALAEKRADSFSIVQSWINISLLHYKKGKHAEGIKLCDQVIDYSERHGDSLNLALGLQNRGLIYGSIAQKGKQYTDYQRALIIYKQLKDHFNGLFVLIDLVGIEIERANNAVAKGLLAQATQIADQFNFSEQRIAITIMNAQLERNQGHYGAAEELLKKAEAMAIQLGRNDQLLGIYEDYLDLYARSGDHEKFTGMMKLYKGTISQQNSQTAAESYEQIRVVYELDKTLEKNKQLMLDIRQKKQILIILLLFIVILLVAGFVIFFQNLRLRESTRSLFNVNVSQLKQHEIQSAVATMPEHVAVKDLDLLSSKDRYYLIIKTIESEKLYLDSQISLQMLASRLGIHPKFVTQSISEFSGTNFSGVINGYRVEEAKRLLIENKEDLKIEDIAAKAGFNNRVSFFNHFKELTGFTPAQFSKLALDKQLASRSWISSEQ